MMNLGCELRRDALQCRGLHFQLEFGLPIPKQARYPAVSQIPVWQDAER